MTAVSEALAVAVGHHRAGRLAEAERGYCDVLAIDPEHAGCLHLSGAVALQSGRHDEAIELIGRALALQPDFAEAHSNLAVALQKRGDVEQAIAHWERALALLPDYAEAQFNLGSALRQQGRLEEAIMLYERALALKPDHPQLRRFLDLALAEQAEADFHAGRMLRRQGRLDEAIARFEAALARKPDFVEAQLNLGTAFHAGGRRDKAIACYRRVLALRPENAGAHLHLAVALHHEGRWGEAIICYERALALRPDFPEAPGNLRLCRAEALLAAGDLPGSIACLEEGLRQGFSAVPSAVSMKPEASSGSSLYPEALRAVLARLADRGIEAFLIGGTLLGAVREGDFLAFDKDLDFGVGCAVTFADLDRALADDPEFERISRPEQEPLLASYRFRRRVVIDFFRFFPQDEMVWHGLAQGPYLIKWTHRRFRLADFSWHGVTVKVPDDTEHFLTELYGDWRTPNPYFGSFAFRNTEGGYTPLLRKIAYGEIFAALLQHRREQTVSLCDQVLALDPEDGLIRELRNRFAPMG